ncbi:probable trehalose-phosphate phosphatase 2 [Nicotiana tomentosiformis]|uniref:probable trehalose-phosphate phosphatase 2 n=1 Tax=Nicotiana tomentosiformis TaxID=4098 RepID=UPI00051CA503|nr:probable trehalose-phosphate phosphatase 2 [Nicotiana tomentosiformis]XP_009629957.1 probable trehalose-phosphate phosphatase 2 [Nicotiana tomentosiformis]XP_018634488.1 probable trehalose-phosphate phosphatase 2 [Nicotiana tomentosiformis]XP_018634489.1 probable trehalose-phosphate phosphatase 2 [Nicotiana tomentosiformis]XP_033508413.1 probable trehalose-phosphate phosphatase 2 [Nicotiana tomentosiformis]XP_033508414.1 probable trehalose-phosphate phosphatase 2 [Nicotiana tomentosiformis]
MRENLKRWLYQAMGFQNELAKTPRIEPISKATKPNKTEPNAGEPKDSKSDLSLCADVKYMSWLKEHPSALSSFQEMIGAAKGKRIVVFLDYDGTLSPIVNDPDSAFMSDLMRSAVREVARLYPTAIISGRSRQKVYGFVKLDEVFYAGSHGMDIMGPAIQASSYDGKYQSKALDKKGNELTVFQPAQDFLPSIEKMLNELEETTSEINGALVEDNRFCISVHYRHVLQEDFGLLEKKVQAVVAKYPCFHLTRGKKVIEIRPSIKWNKGDALVYLLETLGFANSSDVLPIYIGDDRTDEDAFKVLKCRGQGYPIIVSSNPRDTLASYSLRDPSEVLSFLIRLARRGDLSSV